MLSDCTRIYAELISRVEARVLIWASYWASFIYWSDCSVFMRLLISLTCYRISTSASLSYCSVVSFIFWLKLIVERISVLVFSRFCQRSVLLSSMRAASTSICCLLSCVYEARVVIEESWFLSLKSWLLKMFVCWSCKEVMRCERITSWLSSRSLSCISLIISSSVLLDGLLKRHWPP